MHGECKIITFISYKGGVGRSIALANTAYALAEQGKRVGCVDLDLNAPGLRLLFGCPETPPEPLTVASILASGRVLSVEDAALNIQVKKGETIYLLPAMNQGEVVAAIPWHETAKMVTILNSVCTNFSKAKSLEFILIDAKAGLGKASALAAGLSNLAICVFRIDRQCIEGTKWMHKVFKTNGKRTLYLPSMVPSIEKADKILATLRNEIQLEAPIPYVPEMIIDEKVIVRDSPRTLRAGIFREFSERILGLL